MAKPRRQTPDAVRRGLDEIERNISGGEVFALYLDKFRAGGQAQCTTVWTRTAIAYRCRTCQVNDSSAICVSCFQAGDHRHHDYVMYHSDSGGCCDCGDPAAWKEEGFCKAHQRRIREEPTVPAHLHEISRTGVEFVLKELCIWREMIMDAKTLDRSPPSLYITMAEIYVKWLQKICPLAALRSIVCEVITNVPSGVDMMVQNDRTRNRPFLDTMLTTYGRMPESLMEAETTLFLQMLYDQPFKDTFSRALMRHYASWIVPAAVNPELINDYKALDQSLDRGAVQFSIRALDDAFREVMVQLFNVPEITLNLIQTDRLLESVISVLDSVLSHCTNRRDGTVDVDHPAISGNVSGPHGQVSGQVYRRPQGDLKLIVSHEPVALHVLKDRPDVFRSILSIVSLLQWMNPYTMSETVDFEVQLSWTRAISLEMTTMKIPFTLLGRCFSTFPGNEEDVKTALLNAAHVAISSLREAFTKVERSQSSEQVSLHIPLHRVLSAIVSKLVMLPWSDTSQCFLEKLHPALTELEVMALMEHPVRVTAWMAEIRAHMWQGSSEDFSRLELIYRGSIWYDQSMDMDILMLQFCCVARENMGQSVISEMARKFGLSRMVAKPLFGTEGDRIEWTPAKISMLQDFLRLLLLIIRERRNTGMTEKESLRYDVIQWLCVRDHTHSQLAFTLGGVLLDQSKLSSVLQEVAIYNNPRVQERGFYQLKQECWNEFDPLFAHFYASDLEEALERATTVGKLPHYWRLERPREARPPFNKLIKILHTQACHQLIWNVLYCVTELIQHETTATSAEIIGVMALQLLEMALADIRAGGLRPPNSHTAQLDSSLMPSHDISDFIYAKPNMNSAFGVVDWERRESSSTYPSIYEMLVNLQKYRSSFRLVDSVNYVIQLQCSYSMTKLGSESNRSRVPDEYVDDERRKLKKKRQEAILADFKARQKAFLDLVHHEVEPDVVKAREDGRTLTVEDTQKQSIGTREGNSSWAVPEEKFPSKDSYEKNERHECAFCRSECDSDESPTGWIALVQRYNLPSLIHERGEVVQNIDEVTDMLSVAHPSSLLTVVTRSAHDASISGPLDLHPTEHVRCCGHQMHQMCFQRYADSLIKRHCTRSPYEGKGIIDLEKMEFLCPICRRLANVLLPDVNKVVPWKRLGVRQEYRTESLQDEQTNEEVAGLCLEGLIPYTSCELSASLQHWHKYWRTHEDLAECIRTFAAQCLRVRKKFLLEPPDLDGLPLSQILWEALAENIIHCEVETREGFTIRDIAASSSSSASATSTEISLIRGDAAHWLGLTELGKVAMLTNTIPCEEKQQKRLFLLQCLGLDEEIIKQRFEDASKTKAAAAHFEISVGNQEIRQYTHGGKEFREKAEAMVFEAADEKSTVGVRSPPRRRNYLESGSDDSRRNRARRKLAAADDSEVGWRYLKKVVETSDPADVGWLWSNPVASKIRVLATGDPFELLIMLLVSFEGWPTFQELMAMVRVSYVLAVAQVSVAFDKLRGDHHSGVVIMDKTKSDALQLACLPYLRRVALLFQIIVNDDIRNSSTAHGAAVDWMNSEHLQRWLCLPDFEEAVRLGVQGFHAVNLQQIWQNNQPALSLYKVPRRPLLATLPEIFQELVLQNLEVACSNCQQLPAEPAVCLVCGNVFCYATECCHFNGMGECYFHADRESAGVGIYLHLKSTQLVLLRGNRWCRAPSLYLDLHGEILVWSLFFIIVLMLLVRCRKIQGCKEDIHCIFVIFV
ncbi:hypothetical protein R1sor_021026 [Riccia sorocarpa]|uniref:E3 ubiquitin-protein ligase n=1 Tax=Riccia sorocarpa TaxID=122646 RepID=A0ABD3GJ80_9MARC